MYLKANAILRYLIGEDDKLDTLIMCKSSEIDLVTSDQSLYEALGSITPKDNLAFNKLVKMLEVIDVVSYKTGTRQDRKVLKNERVDELRKFAFAKSKEEKRQ